MAATKDYAERVYAGVLGKIIGVYLGRPFEGWTYEKIMATLGEVRYYVHERLEKPLIVTDDDISGTLTFIRALEDYGYDPAITAAQIGQTWLNYLIEQRTVLWWGGMGNSTEHTAYLRLKQGIAAPRSGSTQMNSRVVAEQIGGQIFIDGWAMVSPGEPDRAAELARRAASVSHDGEGVYGAQVVAAIESLAFVESDIDKLIDRAVTYIPKESVIYRMIADIREWHAKEKDWHKARRNLAGSYGYDKYGGNCHMVPNHGLIIFSLLYGEDSFQKTLMVVNTGGWDTDCNSGNVGCIMGIKNGLAGIDAGPDWRGPVADRLFLPTADGGRAVTDAVTEAYRLVNAGRALEGKPPEAPKNGARYHFELPGSIQGFRVEDSAECRATAVLENVKGGSRSGKRSLAIRYHHVAPGRSARVGVDTFIPPDAENMGGYALMASPSVYSGQRISASVLGDPKNAAPIICTLYLKIYQRGGGRMLVRGPSAAAAPGAWHDFAWTVPLTDGAPISEVGFELSSGAGASGSLYVDYLRWDGTPETPLTGEAKNMEPWQKAWVNGVSKFVTWKDPCAVSQNEGTGLLITGCREWKDYELSAILDSSRATAGGIGVRVQGMRRYYALMGERAGKVRLIKELDGTRVLAEADLKGDPDAAHVFRLRVAASLLTASVDGETLFEVEDRERPLTEGAAAVLSTEGYTAFSNVEIKP